MEGDIQKKLLRGFSQKALQMSSSCSCTGVMAFLSGALVSFLLLAASTYRTSDKSMEVGLSFSVPATTQDVKFRRNQIPKEMGCNSLPKEAENGADSDRSTDQKLSLLYSMWSSQLHQVPSKDYTFWSKQGLNQSDIPKAPHIENCKLSIIKNKKLDSYGENGTFPHWSLWKGYLGLELHPPTLQLGGGRQLGHHGGSEPVFPPWVEGSDVDNLPSTRTVQRDLWMHQHPRNCRDPQTRFLLADWEREPGFGIGAQIAGMVGLLSIAIGEKRVLVTKYFNRADHEGCQGMSRSHWSCYFFPETSAECQEQAFELAKMQDAWKNGTITSKENYTSKEIWAGRVPRVWGNPWDEMQPTTEISGNLVKNHRKMDRRWWRAQAVRYLMRFQSEYTCELLNIARHEAFGTQAAKLVLETLPAEWPKVSEAKLRSEMEKYVWSNYKPWVPRPLLSIHVRMGDKACEMEVFGFEAYIRLADRIRSYFPNLKDIWLSSEMQEVIDKSKSYTQWNFHYTNVTRQVGNITMATYEASIGRRTSTDYPFVNFLMAAEADFFIGALGSTWCFLIDGMRSTGGKVMAGYVSVNKDRFW
ncbi:hypothetical protein AMTRI_Chr07g24480 [Amborella trichopoda]